MNEVRVATFNKETAITQATTVLLTILIAKKILFYYCGIQDIQ